MDTKRKGIIKQFSNWYFSRKLLPYWMIMLADTAIVFVVSVFTFWISNKTLITFEQRYPVLITSLVYVLLSLIGARVFRTYRGMLRFSSSVDLLRILYANLLSLVLALTVSFFANWKGIVLIGALSPLNTVIVFLAATLIMWVTRIMVKQLYEQANLDTKTVRVLIYGTLSGGIGVAKKYTFTKPQTV